MRILERDLARGAPEAELAVVFLFFGGGDVVEEWGDGGGVRCGHGGVGGGKRRGCLKVFRSV